MSLPEIFFDKDNKLIAKPADVIKYVNNSLDSVKALELEWLNDLDEEPVLSADIHVDNELKYTVYSTGNVSVHIRKGRD